MYVSATRAKDKLYLTGRYVAYGPRGNRTYNRFLIDALEITGAGFDRNAVEAERNSLDNENRKKNRAEKEKNAADRIREKMQKAKASARKVS